MPTSPIETTRETRPLRDHPAGSVTTERSSAERIASSGPEATRSRSIASSRPRPVPAPNTAVTSEGASTRPSSPASSCACSRNSRETRSSIRTGAADEQHERVGTQLVPGRVLISRSIAQGQHALDRTPRLYKNDSRLHRDNTRPIGELPPVENLIDDEHGERQNEKARDGIGREGVGLPETTNALVREVEDRQDERERKDDQGRNATLPTRQHGGGPYSGWYGGSLSASRR